MKTLLLRYTVPLEIEVPDDFPVTPTEIEKSAEWCRNDHRDGRFPFATEHLHDAAERAANGDLARAIDNHYCERIERHFRAWNAGNFHMEARDRLIERCQKSLGRVRLVEGGHVEVSATWHPLTERYTYDPHVVLCRGDAKGDGSPGDYELATRTVFAGQEAAHAYASGVSRSREPIVTALPLAELRVGEDRGRLDYWVPA